MNIVDEVKLHIDALANVVEQDPNFFASITHYVKQLKELIKAPRESVNQAEFKLLTLKIEEFYAKWRPSYSPKSGVVYIPPHQTSDSDSMVKEINSLVAKLTDLDEDSFKALFHENSNNSSVMKVVEMMPENNKIFVVHGHDIEMKASVARTLEKLGLEPVILHEQANRGRTIIEKFEDHSEDISFAIILLSPDDKGCEVNNFPESAKLRARQNVILELGYFIGKLGRNKVLVLFKDENNFEHPSDFVGVLYIPFKDGWELEMVGELQSCGYDVDANRLL